MTPAPAAKLIPWRQGKPSLAAARTWGFVVGSGDSSSVMGRSRRMRMSALMPRQDCSNPSLAHLVLESVGELI